MGPCYSGTPIITKQQMTTQAARDNHSFVTRIAKLAASVADDKDLCNGLLFSLGSYALPNESNDPSVLRYSPDVEADLTNAMPVLWDFYKKGADDSQQFSIEGICLTFGRKFFDQLEAKGGPMIAEVWDAYTPQWVTPGPGQLILGHAFEAVEKGSVT
jgi:hypothetical protein